VESFHLQKTMNYLGEIAALLTSLSFSVTSTMFTLAAQRVGAVVVNRTRLVFAVIFLAITHWIVLGTLLPIQAAPDRWLWLSISGIVGLVLGDAFLFQAFIWIGPRLSMLMMSLAPIIAALVAWIFLGEVLHFGEITGIVITLAGIAWVILDRNGKKSSSDRDYGRGILYGLGAAIGQALGLVFAKNGLYGDFSPISGNIIRMISAFTVMWVIAVFRQETRLTLKTLNTNRRVLLFIFGGAIAGPFIGVSLSLFSIQNADIGIASTLMALPPVFLLPIGYFVFKERYGWGAIFGTTLAIIGVALLFVL
jgi:drug/metabolite transporter (DMT)-like permease